MENLKIDGQSITLVDQVEDKLLNYFRSQDLKVGDSIPNEIELSSALGVARSVLLEALSRLKMMGMIESRTRRGMILTEPFILGGMTGAVDIMELEEIVNAGVALGNNEYANLSEYTFHSKLYEITGNKTIVQFQSIIHPVMNFVKTNLRERVEAINIELEKKGKIVTHTDLLNFIKNKDEMGYRNAIEQHFYVYKKLIYDRAVLGEQNKGQSQ